MALSRLNELEREMKYKNPKPDLLRETKPNVLPHPEIKDNFTYVPYCECDHCCSARFQSKLRYF